MKYLIGIWNPFHGRYDVLRSFTAEGRAPLVVDFDDIRHIRMSYSSFVTIPCSPDWPCA